MVWLAAAYDEVVEYADQHKCWDLLSCPKFYYIGIMELTRWDHFPIMPNTTLASNHNFPGPSTQIQQPLTSLSSCPRPQPSCFPCSVHPVPLPPPLTTSHPPLSNSRLSLSLSSGIVKHCEPAMLLRILNLAKNLLNSLDNRQKILARAVYAQVKAWGEHHSPRDSFPVAEEH